RALVASSCADRRSLRDSVSKRQESSRAAQAAASRASPRVAEERPWGGLAEAALAALVPSCCAAQRRKQPPRSTAKSNSSASSRPPLLSRRRDALAFSFVHRKVGCLLSLQGRRRPFAACAERSGGRGRFSLHPFPDGRSWQLPIASKRTGKRAGAAHRMRARVSRRFFPCPRLLPSRAGRLAGRAPDRSKPAVEFRGAFEQAESVEFAETRGAFAITVFARSEYREKRHAGGLRGEGVVDVVAEVERRGGIASLQDFHESIGERLFRRVVHGDDGAEIPRGWPC